MTYHKICVIYKIMIRSGKFRQGYIELLILHFLNQKDCDTTEMSAIIQDISKEYLDVPVGLLYPELYFLMEHRLVTRYEVKVEGRKYPHVYYQIGESGRERLKELLADYYRTMDCVQKVLDFQFDSEA